MVFFEAPHRLGDFLADAAAALGTDRPGAVCRELTKTYEEVVRGGLGELAAWAQGDVRGEVTVVVAGAVHAIVEESDAVAQVLGRVADGARLKEAVAEVAGATGWSKNDLYEAALAARRG